MVIEDDVAAMHLRAPLLGSEASKAEAPRWKVEGSKHDEVGEQLGGGRAGLDVLFARRLLRLLSACRAWPAASFILLALAESLLTSEGGRVVSGFVRTLVDNDMRAFGVQVRNAAAVYLATTVLHSFTKFLAGMLALSWRRRLTLKLHAQYCKDQSWYRVVGVDNPDQRIARDVAAWSEQLAKVLQEVAVVPFEVLLYTHLTLQVLGWWVPVAAAYGFFTAGVLVQRAIAAPIARLVFRQRQSEGAFRAAHMRLRFLREEVAFYGGSCAERHHLGEVLRDVLAKQAAVVRRSWLQDAVTKALDYQGSILNYVCIALAVWSGRVKAASDAGEMASIISKSSFYMLGLIYAFTRVINTADTVASLAGLTARVAQLQEELEAQEGASSGGRPAIGCQTHARAEASASQDMTLAMNAVRAAAPPPGAGAGAAGDGAAADGQSSGARSAGAAAAAAAKQPGMGSSELQILARGGERGRYAPDLGRHHEKHAAQATMLISPVAITLPNQEAMEVSVHSMGSGLLLEEVMAVFPTCPCSGSIVAVVTFQSAPPGVELDATSEDMCQKAGTYMDRMLEEFLWFEGAVRALLEVEGFWCNAVDPRTGRALHGPRGSRYSEVVGAEVLLGYPQDMCGPCPVVLHPRFGKSAYPATLFTNAPLPMLLRCFLTCNASPSSVLGADAESSSGRSDVGCSEASCSEPSEPAACGEDEGPEADDCSLSSQQPTTGPPPPPPADLCYPVDALLGGRGGVAGSGAPMASVLSTMALAGRAQHCVSYSGDGGVGFAASLGLPQGTQLWTVSSMPLTGTNSLPVRGPLPTPAGRPGRPAALGVASEPLLEVCGLALALPHAMVVVRNCSFSVAVGDNIQVSGPSGSGKTSLLRCLAGLQPPSSGTVKFGLHAKVMFVPQRPILAPGATLRHQLLYPDCLAPAAAPPDGSSAPDGYLQTLLHRVELPHLLQHTGGSFSTCCDWTALSPGELQRLAFARVLHRQPTLVVMDEPTSALPPQQASRMLSLLTDAGISFLIASHDAHVEGATRFIQLFGDGSGSWSLV